MPPFGSTKVLSIRPVAPARSNRTVNHVLTAVSRFYDDLGRTRDITEGFRDKTTAWNGPTSGTTPLGKAHREYTTAERAARTATRREARAAGVSTSYLYAQPAPCERIEGVRASSGPARPYQRALATHTDAGKDILLAATERRTPSPTSAPRFAPCRSPRTRGRVTSSWPLP